MRPAVTVTVRREPGAFTRSLAALLLRAALGLLFLTSGLAKLEAKKTGKYPAMITEQFPAKIAFPGDVRYFADAVPYAEIGLGAALLAGFWTPLAAFLAGALLLALFYGQLHLHKAETYPAMMSYLLFDAAVLWVSPVTSNYLSLDGILFGWFWRPRGEGEFVRQEEAPRVAVRTR